MINYALTRPSSIPNPLSPPVCSITTISNLFAFLTRRVSRHAQFGRQNIILGSPFILHGKQSKDPPSISKAYLPPDPCSKGQIHRTTHQQSRETLLRITRLATYFPTPYISHTNQKRPSRSCSNVRPQISDIRSHRTRRQGSSKGKCARNQKHKLPNSLGVVA